MRENRRNFLVIALTIFTFLGFTTSDSFSQNIQEPLPPRWVGKEKPKKLQPFHTGKPFGKELILELAGARPNLGRICILIDGKSVSGKDILPFQVSLLRQGYNSVSYVIKGGGPEDVRNHLIQLYKSPKGLVGGLGGPGTPYAIFEMLDNWSGVVTYTEFVCDVYFMDMTGTWKDAGSPDGALQANNGKFDAWEKPGGHQLEIFFGRLPGNLPLLGQPSDVVCDYLARVIKFKKQCSPSSGKSATYNDDDWGDLAARDFANISLVLRGKDFEVADQLGEAGNNCTAADYKDRMSKDYRLVSVRSHGNPTAHGFYQDWRTVFNMVNSEDYIYRNADFAFYHLYVCQGGNFLYDNCLGGIVTLGGQGLFAVSSSKTGGMWYREDVFYGALAAGKSVGEAFRTWMNMALKEYPGTDQEKFQWWLGQILLGDPTITLR